MRLGRLNRRIAIRRLNSTARDALNAPVEVWEDGGTFWAEQLQQRPTEAWKAGQTAAQSETVWRLRWLDRTAAITPKDRLICDGRLYRIIGITEPVARAIVEITGIAFAEEGLGQ